MPMLLHDDLYERDDAGLDATVAAPSIADAALASGELGAEADARTAELDEGRQVPQDLYDRVARAGLFRMLVPSELGGLGLDALTWFRTGLDLARHEASFGWVVTQGAAELGWIAAGGDDAWARALLADPLATSASSSAGAGSLQVTADGTHATFTGSWGFDTGSPNASWIGGLALVEGATRDDGAPVIRWGWVPADRALVDDDWDASGLRGTGSHSITIPAQEIPTAWTFSPSDRTTNDRGPYRVVVGNGFWPIATSVAAVQLGNARRALDEARQLVLTKAPAPAFVPLAQSAVVQRALVEAEGRWSAALASVERELSAMWEQAELDGELSTNQRVRLHRANLDANAAAVAIVDAVCQATGTSSVSRRHVLARCQRDAYALRSHITVGAQSIEWNARMALGLVDTYYMI